MDVSRSTVPPPLEKWNEHKDKIINLYLHSNLKAVRSRLEKEHNFKASERMYHYRLKQWDISKRRNARRAVRLSARRMEKSDTFLLPSGSDTTSPSDDTVLDDSERSPTSMPRTPEPLKYKYQWLILFYVEEYARISFGDRRWLSNSPDEMCINVATPLGDCDGVLHNMYDGYNSACHFFTQSLTQPLKENSIKAKLAEAYALANKAGSEIGAIIRNESPRTFEFIFKMVSRLSRFKHHDVGRSVTRMALEHLTDMANAKESSQPTMEFPSSLAFSRTTGKFSSTYIAMICRLILVADDFASVAEAGWQALIDMFAIHLGEFHIDTVRQRNHLDEAKDMYESAECRLRGFLNLRKDDSEEDYRTTVATRWLAQNLLHQGEFGKSRDLCESFLRRDIRPRISQERLVVSWCDIYAKLSWAHCHLRDFDGARTYMGCAIDTSQRHFGEYDSMTLYYLTSLEDILREADWSDEAAAVEQKRKTILEKSKPV